ncbi:MAG: hypothetical protein VKI82_03335 [Leptolyngbya sp.]|nr:hypothetical protein [Leptolyngbya sp.]
MAVIREYKFGTKHQAAALTGLSSETLKKYRLIDQTLLEGIHWVKLNSRTIRYNLTLLLDWMENRSDPAAHQQAIEQYLITKLSNQKKRPGRSSQVASN